MSMCSVAPLVLCLSAMVLAPVVSSMSKRSDDRDPLEAVVDQLSKEVLALKAQDEARQNEIASLKAAQAHTIAFSAYMSDEPNVQASHGSAVRFRGLYTNMGGGYSTVTSAFTAPVSGQYFFIVHADCTADFRGINLSLNGRTKIAAHNDLHDGHVTGSGILSLQKGDIVNVQFMNDAGKVDAGVESTFSGFLVK